VDTGFAIGAKPVEQPTTFDFAINRPTARTLGIDIPQTLLALAEVIHYSVSALGGRKPAPATAVPIPSVAIVAMPARLPDGGIG
jgi:hypothetical protein